MLRASRMFKTTTALLAPTTMGSAGRIVVRAGKLFLWKRFSALGIIVFYASQMELGSDKDKDIVSGVLYV